MLHPKPRILIAFNWRWHAFMHFSHAYIYILIIYLWNIKIYMNRKQKKIKNKTVFNWVFSMYVIIIVRMRIYALHISNYILYILNAMSSNVFVFRLSLSCEYRSMQRYSFHLAVCATESSHNFMSEKNSADKKKKPSECVHIKHMSQPQCHMYVRTRENGTIDGKQRKSTLKRNEVYLVNLMFFCSSSI